MRLFYNTLLISDDVEAGGEAVAPCRGVGGAFDRYALEVVDVDFCGVGDGGVMDAGRAVLVDTVCLYRQYVAVGIEHVDDDDQVAVGER